MDNGICTFYTKEVNCAMSFSSEAKAEIRNNYFTIKKRYSKINRSNEKQQMVQRDMIIDAFLRSGSVSDPEKFYHLEIVCTDGEEADRLQEALKSFGIQSGHMVRKERYVVYLKDSEAISDMLILLGATNAVLSFENVVILKEMKGNVQRRVNFETANLLKTVSASVRQVEDIELIKEKGEYNNLPEGLKELAELRVQYPDASLAELAERLPGTGKSGINHRFRRIARIANQLRK